MRILILIGTRPEAIKLAPLIQAFSRTRVCTRFTLRVCLTGQHRELVDDTLPAFGITADDNLGILAPGQTLSEASAKILTGLEATFAAYRPDLVIVQGDTTTAFAGSLAAFYARIPIAHIEAGLRTGNADSPFPEEMNRRLVTRLAHFHFAPTTDAAQNLIAEGVPEKHIWVTGNTGIDAVRLLSQKLAAGVLTPELPFALDPARKLILVTAHRRENIPHGLHGIVEAVRTLACRPDVQIVFPLHPNPQVRAIVEPALAQSKRIHVTPPLSYPACVDLLRRSHLILSDSGGIQEEAPALGKPVLVLRDTTERPEAVAAGATLLVGTNPAQILAQAARLLDNGRAYAGMARIRDIYGDGKASTRIAATLSRVLHSAPAPEVATGLPYASLPSATEWPNKHSQSH